MPRFRPLLGFSLSFLVSYGLLIAPWPGAKRAYARCFISLGRELFVEEGRRRLLRWDLVREDDHRWDAKADVTIKMANRDLLDRNGNGIAYTMALDTWRMGWVPTAFFLALVAATPISWRRRRWPMFWGSIGVHSLIFLTLAILIWHDSARVALLTLSPFWQQIANRLNDLAQHPMTFSFFAVTLIWISVAFRRKDLMTLREKLIHSDGRTRNGPQTVSIHSH